MDMIISVPISLDRMLQVCVNCFKDVVVHGLDSTQHCKWIVALSGFFLLFMISTFIRYQLRRKIRNAYGTASSKIDPNLSIVNYLKCLTFQSSTKERFARSTPFHRVYVATLPSQSEIRIKEPRSYTIYRPIIYLFRFLTHSSSDPIHSIQIHDSWPFRLKIGKRRNEVLERVQVLLCNSIHRHLDQQTSYDTPGQIGLIANVLRAVRFFHDQKIPLLTLDWNHVDFIPYLEDIGKLLPPAQYVVIGVLPHYRSSHVTFEVLVRGIFKKLSTKALSRLDRAKERAREKIKEARESVTSRLSNLLDFLEDEESQWNASPKSFQADEAVSKDNLDMLTELELQMFWNKKHVALQLVEQLKSFPLDLQKNLKHPILIIANNYRKRVKLGDIGQDVFDRLFMQITACKLGVKYSTLEKNPSFYTFAIKNAIHRYLMVYNHVIRVSDDEKEAMSILFEGEYRQWTEIQDKLARDENDPLVITGQYSSRGLINQGMYDWETLEPFIQVPPKGSTFDPFNISTGIPPALQQDYGNRYILEFCSWILEKPRLGGDHIWIRLKTPEGLIHSVGQYRPKKFGFHEQFIFPMKIKMSIFCSPDICEFWTGPYRTLSIQITKSQFLAMKERIEKDQAAKEHVYQLFQDNCVNYAMSIARLADIQLPTELQLFDLLVHDKLVDIKDKVFPYLPESIRSFSKRMWAFTFNWLSLVFGAGIVSKEVKTDPKYQHIEPFIKNLGDMTNPEKVIANHPYVIGEYVAKDIEKWRQEQSKVLQDEIEKARHTEPLDQSKINELEKKLDDIQYDIPLKYRVSFHSSRGIRKLGSFEDFNRLEE